jgi:alkanesulfonate monooxygenase SsuD/methylene tetrahydromethanopterin reductase-like flavin-dependent oxidoreductase (luciferase family)
VKASFVHSLQYLDVAHKGLPVAAPVSPALFEPDAGQRSVQAGIDLFEMADELGFDWVSITEHHYSPRQLTPNPLLLAGALTKRIRHAKIAILGSTIPLLNPVRVA